MQHLGTASPAVDGQETEPIPASCRRSAPAYGGLNLERLYGFLHIVHTHDGAPGPGRVQGCGKAAAEPVGRIAVSYTHLTLPTILRV